jgi:hypothetical protein
VPAPLREAKLEAAPPPEVVAAAPSEPIRGDPERLCSDVLLTKDELCKCLAGSPHAVTCKVEALEGSFGAFTPSTSEHKLVVYENEGGMIVVGTLDRFRAGRPMTTHVVEVAKRSVLWMEGRDGTRYGDRDVSYAVLCPAREPGATSGVPTCLEIPIREDTDLNAPSEYNDVIRVGEPPRFMTSRLAISFPRRGYVEVRADGKLWHPELRKYIGRHRFE